MAAPGAFVAPSQFEEVKWKAGLPKGSELWLAQLPLSVDLDSLTGVKLKLRGKEGVIGTLETEDGAALRVLDDGDMVAHQLYAVDPGAAAGRQVRRISRRITLATAAPERFGAARGANAGAGGASTARADGDNEEAEEVPSKKKKKKKDRAAAAEDGAAVVGGEDGEAGEGKKKKKKRKPSQEEVEPDAGGVGQEEEEAAPEVVAEEKKKKKKKKKTTD